MLRFLKEWLYYFLALSLIKLTARIPRKIALTVGAMLANLIFGLAKSDKRRTYDNLRLCLGIKNKQYIADIAEGCFRHWGKSVIEVMQFPKLTRKEVNQLVVFEGRENLDSALKAGRGVVLLTAHFGNWELLGASLTLNGYPLNVIAREVRSEKLQKLMEAHRGAAGMKVIYRGASVKNGLRCLKRNEILGILPDVDTQTDGVFVDFLGRLAYTPIGPVAIALKTQALIVPAFIIRQPDDSHRIVIEKPLKLQITGQKDVDIQVNTQLITKVIEHYVRKYPTQWVWMHQRFKTQPPKEKEHEYLEK
jgi:KDO2-lipid IV(A) lauroyltransferase